MVATDLRQQALTFLPWRAALLLAFAGSLQAAVLPEERTDVMYHRYEGGGVTIDGPSLLVRKNVTDDISVVGNYYVDSISSASIDVEVTSSASRYSEERTEYSLGLTYLHESTTFSGGLVQSDENDYEAETFSFNISEEFFGGLSAFSMGYGQGNDTVLRSDLESFEETIDRQNFRLGFNQVLTSTLLLSFNYETITDEGYLNNPYRYYRYQTPGVGDGWTTATEVYPDTRTSDAASFTLMYYLPYRASLRGMYRYFTDDWEIDAHTYQLQYTHPWKDRWIFDATLRQYQQGSAYFYSDLFNGPSLDDKDFRARDKELSDMESLTIGFAVSYQLPPFATNIVERSTISFQWDHIMFDYNNFRDLTVTAPVGEEPLYSFDADVWRLFFTMWY